MVASGTTAAIAITASGGLSRIGISVATIDGYISSAEADSAATLATSGTSLSLGVACNSGGVALWTTCRDAVNATTWSGATEDDDQTPGTSYQQSSAHYLATASGSQSAMASWTGGANATLLAASWR